MKPEKRLDCLVVGEAAVGLLMNGSAELEVGGHYFLWKRFHAGAPALFRGAQQLGLTTSLDCNHDPAERWEKCEA